MVEKVFEEVLEVISDGQEEISEERKIILDKTTRQSSVKIPKSLALKSGLNEKSVFDVVFNISEEDTLEKIKNSKLVIYLREVKNGKGEKNT